MTVKRRKAPDGLQKPGKRMWSAILTEFDLDERELLVLEQACRQADAVAALEAEIQGVGARHSGLEGADAALADRDRAAHGEARGLEAAEQSGASRSGRAV